MLTYTFEHEFLSSVSFQRVAPGLPQDTVVKSRLEDVVTSIPAIDVSWHSNEHMGTWPSVEQE